MGLTVLSLDVASPADPDRREAVDFLVDSGAIYSFVPWAVLERLGIAAHGRQRFRLADGSTIERDRGDALYFHAGRRGAAPVIFAEAGDTALLGAVTLESLGLVLDAVRRDLLPLPMIVASVAAGGSTRTATRSGGSDSGPSRGPAARKSVRARAGSPRLSTTIC